MQRLLLFAAMTLAIGAANEAAAQNFFNVNPVPGLRPANDNVMRWYGPIYGYPYSRDPLGVNWRNSPPRVHYKETMLDPLILDLDQAAPPGRVMLLGPTAEADKTDRVIIGELRPFPNGKMNRSPRFRR